MEVKEATFNELWSESKLFRNFFIGENGYFLKGDLNWSKAEELWNNRYPKIKWCLCGEESCSVMVPVKDGMCIRHSMEFQSWRFKSGVLWQRQTVPVSFGQHNREYKNYLLVMAKKIFGEIPHGYVVVKADGNPFNFKKNNLRLLSKISVLLVQHGILSANAAIGFDKFIHPFVKNHYDSISKNVKQSVFAYFDISKIIGKDVSFVTKAVYHGMLDFNELGSIVNFVNKVNDLKLNNVECRGVKLKVVNDE